MSSILQNAMGDCLFPVVAAGKKKKNNTGKSGVRTHETLVKRDFKHKLKLEDQ
jgi:hypothetical protein